MRKISKFSQNFSQLWIIPHPTQQSVECLSAAAAVWRLSTSLTLDTGHKRPGCWVLTLSPGTTPELSASASLHMVTLNNVAFLNPWNIPRHLRIQSYNFVQLTNKCINSMWMWICVCIQDIKSLVFRADNTLSVLNNGTEVIIIFSLQRIQWIQILFSKVSSRF